MPNIPPDRGQQSLNPELYPDAWQAFFSNPSSFDGMMAARQILMQQYGLSPEEANSICASFIVSNGYRSQRPRQASWEVVAFATDDFTYGYAQAMLFANCYKYKGNGEIESVDGRYEVGGSPPFEAFTPRSQAEIARECKEFQEANSADLEALYNGYCSEGVAGQSFALSRNGHGSGFFEYEDDPTPGAGDAAKRLQEASHVYGESMCMINDDETASLMDEPQYSYPMYEGDKNAFQPGDRVFEDAHGEGYQYQKGRGPGSSEGTVMGIPVEGMWGDTMVPVQWDGSSEVSYAPIEYLSQAPQGQLFSKTKAEWVEAARTSSTPCAIEIGEPQREIEITPLRPPVPLPAPEPTPERTPEKEPAKAIEIGDPQREIEITPLRPPVPLPAPEPKPEPIRTPEKEPARVGSWEITSDDNELAGAEHGDMYLEPIRAVRVLDVAMAGYFEPRLMSNGTGGHKHEWKPGEAAVAKCAAGNDHEAPDAGCRCGFYTVDEDHIDVMKGYTNKPYVIVELSIWGKIKQHEYGQRSQYAYPYEIRVPPSLIWFDEYTSEDMAKMLGAAYQCDARVETPPWPMKWHALPRGIEIDPNKEVQWENLEKNQFQDGWYVAKLQGDQIAHFYSVIGRQNPEPRERYHTTVYGFFDAEGRPKAYVATLGDDIKHLTVWEIRETDEYATHHVTDWFNQLRKQGSYIEWDHKSPQSMIGEDEESSTLDEPYLLSPETTFTVDDPDSLLYVYDEIEQNPQMFSQTQPREDYRGPRRVNHDKDKYGLDRAAYKPEHYKPHAIKFPIRNWYSIASEVISHLEGANDPNDAWGWDKAELSELAKLCQALYIVPAFLVSSEVNPWTKDMVSGENWKDGIKRIPEFINDLEYDARQLEGFSPEQPPQFTQLFDPNDFQTRTPPPIRNMTVAWFINYLSQLFGMGQKVKTAPPSNDFPQGYTQHYYESNPETMRQEAPPSPYAPNLLGVPTPPGSGGGAMGGGMGGTLSRTAETVMEPGQIQDFDFENWTVTDPGWQAYRQFGGTLDMSQYIMSHPDDMASPMGITWQEAQKWLLEKIGDGAPEGVEAIRNATPNEPFQWSKGMVDIGDGRTFQLTFAIRKIESEYRNSKVAAEEGKPKWSFMYYKSALEVVPWSHNVRYREIAQRLLNKFNTRLEDGGWKDDESEWSGGDIYKEKDGLRVEFKHLASPDIQSSALQAIRTWYDSEPREDEEIEWEMDDEEHRKEANTPWNQPRVFLRDPEPEWNAWHLQPNDENTDPTSVIVRRHLQNADKFLSAQPDTFTSADFSNHYYKNVLPAMIEDYKGIPFTPNQPPYENEDAYASYKTLKPEDHDEYTDSNWQWKQGWQQQFALRDAKREAQKLVDENFSQQIKERLKELQDIVHGGDLMHNIQLFNTARDKMVELRQLLHQAYGHFQSFYYMFRTPEDRYDWEEQTKTLREMISPEVYAYYNAIDDLSKYFIEPIDLFKNFGPRFDEMKHAPQGIGSQGLGLSQAFDRLQEAENQLRMKMPARQHPEQAAFPFADWNFEDYNARQDEEPDEDYNDADNFYYEDY